MRKLLKLQLTFGEHQPWVGPGPKDMRSSRPPFKLDPSSQTREGSKVLAVYTACLRKRGSPGRLAQLVGASSHAPKGCGFDAWSGRTPRMLVQSPVRLRTGDNLSKLFSYTDVSPSLSFPFSP